MVNVNDNKHDDITNRRVTRVAKEHRLTVDEVNTALGNHPMNQDQEKFLRRTLAMELVELDELQQAFRDKALKDHDVAACDGEDCRTQANLAWPRRSRRSCRHSGASAVEPRETSTERLSAAIARICDERPANGEAN
jgi:hypothetical protein